MHYSISHKTPSRFASTSIAATVLLSLLLVFATSASAGAVDMIAAAAGESPPSTEPPPLPSAAPEPEAAPEPVEATEAATGTASVTATSELPAAPAVPDLRSTGAGAEAGVTAVAETAVQAVAPATDRVTELAGEVHQDIAETAAPALHSSAETVAQISDRAVGHIPALPDRPLREVSETLQRGPLGPIPPDGVAKNLLSPVEAPSGVHVGAFSAPAAPGTLPIGAYPHVKVTILDGFLPLQDLVELGGLDPLQLEAPSAAGNLAESALGALVQIPVGAGGASLLDVGGRAENLASLPLNGNTPTPPSPDSPSIAASGSAGSSFVPVAVLLALLALAAPAILRRLREVPDFPVPILFVCALERPG